MSVGEECVQPEELRTLLAKKPNPIAYDGFEPSGRMHIAQVWHCVWFWRVGGQICMHMFAYTQGVQKCINVNKLTKCGVQFKFWYVVWALHPTCALHHPCLASPTPIIPIIPRVADWFAQLNNKMGGDLKKIQTVGQYFVEIWKAVGMDMSRVEFLNASEEINKRPDEYWTLVCFGGFVCCWERGMHVKYSAYPVHCHIHTAMYMVVPHVCCHTHALASFYTCIGFILNKIHAVFSHTHTHDVSHRSWMWRVKTQ